jgi:hypothetical protein
LRLVFGFHGFRRHGGCHLFKTLPGLSDTVPGQLGNSPDIIRSQIYRTQGEELQDQPFLWLQLCQDSFDLAGFGSSFQQVSGRWLSRWQCILYCSGTFIIRCRASQRRL